ncbi:DUF6688 family protein [Clostridium saccharoperbutylacetonicum]|uniref:DUF6688 family protein n=1 Tax=Clostridium saccharoperbutylacetonicum TaxID=36745 RepID=UPI0039EA5D68
MQFCIHYCYQQSIIHKKLRHFYDTYGFPIAKMIHSPYIADMVYFIMKPLEWSFLIILYFCDVNPENRIAVQYFPKIRRKN